jgi:Uma2 family endonuclease
MSTTEQITTAEQLLHASDLGRCELVRGELSMMSPGGFDHGRIIINITGSLIKFLDEHPCGVLTGAETGFHIGREPDTVRAPDVGFVCRERIPAVRVRGFFPGPPDLAVEVLSPDDRAGEVLVKVRDWLDSGCRGVWIVDPRSRTVCVHRSGRKIVMLDETDTLNGDDLLPGFTLPVAEIFID